MIVGENTNNTILPPFQGF